MDISRQVFRRSASMGRGYVILSFVLGVILVAVFNVAGIAGNVASNGQTVNVTQLLGSYFVPFGAMVGVIITIPVYMLFVFDKNAGVLEYLLAVGMDQREVFTGYLKAALGLALVVMLPLVLLNTVLTQVGPSIALEEAGLAIATGVADVSFVTVLMTAFSSMQRKPSGMNSPLGISIGVVLVLPEFLLATLLGTAILWLDLGIFVAVSVTAIVLLFSLDRLIRREKMLP